MRRILAVVGAVLALAAITTGVVFALNYEGEDFCQDTPAWPNGTYLGQMHPYHSDFYRGYAERRGWDPCTTWATDQRNSAIRGLRELGYSVREPGVVLDRFRVDGIGPSVASITLSQGAYVVDATVNNNTGSFGSGTNFIASVITTDGAYVDFIVSEIGTSVTVQTVLRVDRDEAGAALLEVEVGQDAAWSFTFSKQ